MKSSDHIINLLINLDKSKEIPNELINLTKLNCSGIDIKEIPAELVNLTGLVLVHISNKYQPSW